MDASLFDSVLAKLDEVEEAPAANDANASDLAWTVKQVRQGNLENLNWRKVTKTLKIADLGAIDGAAEFSLYHIAEGGSIPQHNHSGRKQHSFCRAASATRVVHTTPEILLLVKLVKSIRQPLLLAAIAFVSQSLSHHCALRAGTIACSAHCFSCERVSTTAANIVIS